jgi:hypothetical protein
MQSLTSEITAVNQQGAFVKGYVARSYEEGRTLEILRQQTLDGFYGNVNGSHAGVTRDLCDKYINRCQRYCDLFIKEHISGALCLDDLKNENPAQLAADEIDEDIADEEDESDDEADDGDV